MRRTCINKYRFNTKGLIIYKRLQTKDVLRSFPTYYKQAFRKKCFYPMLFSPFLLITWITYAPLLVYASIIRLEIQLGMTWQSLLSCFSLSEISLHFNSMMHQWKSVPILFSVPLQHWAKWDMAPLSLWGGLSTMPLFQYPSTWTGLFTTLLCHYTVHILCCLHNWRNGEERMQKPEYFWNADFCLLIQVLWIALHLMQLELHYIHNKMWDLILWKKL